MTHAHALATLTTLAYGHWSADVDVAAITQRTHDLIFQFLVLLGVVETQQKLDGFVSTTSRDSADGGFAKFDSVRAACDVEEFGACSFAFAVSETGDNRPANLDSLISVVNAEKSVDCWLTRTSRDTGDRQPSLWRCLATDRYVAQHHDCPLTSVSTQGVK